MHGFRFALQASQLHDPKSWRDLAKKAESVGISTLFLPDHFGEQLAPLVALTVAQEVTTTLKVGTLVLGNDYRHPVVVARELATLDIMSQGRLEAGIGAGWMKSDYDQSGIVYDEPKVRVERFQESIEVMKMIWSGEVTTFEGKHYQLSQATGSPKPYTQPHPTLLIGGGSRRVLSIAAREAQIVGINPNLASGVIGPEVIASSSAQNVDKRIEWVKLAAGERFDEIELQSLSFFATISDNGREVRQNLSSALGFSEQEVEESPSALIGSKAEIIEKLYSSRERWGFTYWVIHEPELDDFQPIIAELDGK